MPPGNAGWLADEVSPKGIHCESFSPLEGLAPVFDPRSLICHYVQSLRYVALNHALKNMTCKPFQGRNMAAKHTGHWCWSDQLAADHAIVCSTWRLVSCSRASWLQTLRTRKADVPNSTVKIYVLGGRMCRSPRGHGCLYTVPATQLGSDDGLVRRGQFQEFFFSRPKSSRSMVLRFLHFMENF